MSYISNLGIRDGDDPSLLAGVRERSLQTIGPAYSYDAFRRFRVVQPSTLFEAKQTLDAHALLFDEATFGTGSSTFSAANAESQMATSASGDAVIRQTFARFNYSPAKSQYVLMTFGGMGSETNIRKRVGLFETSNAADSVPQNGIFLENDGGTISFNIAKNGTVTETATQASWNTDTLDGSGPSGVTLDLSKVQIMFIDFAWLGVGMARVGFIIDGEPIIAHRFAHANVDTSVYTSTPNLPIAYSIYQSGAGSGQFNAICASVSTEGGARETWLNFSHRTTDEIDCGTSNTSYALLALRNGSPGSREIVPARIGMVATSNNDEFYAELLLNPTFSAAPTFVAVANSVAEVANFPDTGAVTVTGGTRLFSTPANSDTKVDVGALILPQIGSAIDGTADVLAVVCTPINPNLEVAAAIDWREST